MALITLKSLHGFLRLLENSPELQRRMPTSTQSPRTIKEGLFDIGKLIGLDSAVFKDPRNVAAIIGPQRFVMIGGEPSVTDHINRVFENAKVLLMVLIEPAHFVKAAPGQMGPGAGGASPRFPAKTASSAGSLLSKTEPGGFGMPSKPVAEAALESLKPLLWANLPLTCRLFRALFEHMLGFASSLGVQPGNVLLVSELTARKEHNKTFLSTAMYILGQEIDRDNLTPFIVEQDLFGMHIFEHMLRNRDFCDAYYLYRRLERAFLNSPAEEEAQLRDRLDQFNARFGGKAESAPLFEATPESKALVDAYLAATDLIEAMTLTPWGISLIRAIALTPAYCIRSIKTIAAHFERFADGTTTKEQANKEITDHLLAFSRQFLADPQPPKTDALV